MLRRNLGSKAIRMVLWRRTAMARARLTVHGRRSRSRFCLNDDQVEVLARHAVAIEKHYGRPMDIEWGKDGDGKLYIVQARPETVRAATPAQRSFAQAQGSLQGAGHGPQHRPAHRRRPARIVRIAKEMHRVQPGDVLVADMTDPDWEPVMKRAAAIVTNRGGRTCHAAIIARELGIPASSAAATQPDSSPTAARDRVLRRGR
jgi:pyruvate, water dikinase